MIYHDPLVETVMLGNEQRSSVGLTPELLQEQDLVLVLVAQQDVDWELIAKEASLVFDCCNALQRKGDNVVRL